VGKEVLEVFDDNEKDVNNKCKMQKWVRGDRVMLGWQGKSAGLKGRREGVARIGPYGVVGGVTTSLPRLFQSVPVFQNTQRLFRIKVPSPLQPKIATKEDTNTTV